jgi:hypothetical protein
MRFARVCRAALMLAAAQFVLLRSPVRSQIPSDRSTTAPQPVDFLPRGFLDCAGKARPLPASFRSPALGCNLTALSVQADPVRLRLLDMGARGRAIEQAREHVLAILRADNSCSAWFREANPDAADIFESLNFSLADGPKNILAFKSSQDILLQHPYSARVEENAGPNATVLLNAHGPFFVKTAEIVEQQAANGFLRRAGLRELRIDSYVGGTLPAQMTTLLHELGHVIGRLPDDSDESSGLSMQNTERVLHACRAEINASARQHRDKRM